jgi:hypothetical protein
MNKLKQVQDQLQTQQSLNKQLTSKNLVFQKQIDDEKRKR